MEFWVNSNGAKFSNPATTVRNDIQNLVNECEAVTVVAHSDGAYLSVDAIQKVQDVDKDKLHLITFGSGFAPVSLLRYIGQDCCRTAGFILEIFRPSFRCLEACIFLYMLCTPYF